MAGSWCVLTSDDHIPRIPAGFSTYPTCSKRAEVKGAPLTQKKDASIVPPIPPQTYGEKKIVKP